VDFQEKEGCYGYITKYKAHLVAKFFSQVQGIDYEETFASVAKIDSIQLALAIVATRKWEVHHMDVKNAFLHGYLMRRYIWSKPKGICSGSIISLQVEEVTIWTQESTSGMVC
jgi:hypothetical protein